jgi:DNA-binding response OmpR family regulator
LGEQSLLPSLDRQFYSDEHVYVDLRDQVLMLDRQRLSLSPMEYRLLALLVQHAGEVVPRAIIMTQVWGYAPDRRTRTVDVHIQRLRQKLGACADKYLETVFGVGYRFRPRDSAPTSGDIKDVPE